MLGITVTPALSGIISGLNRFSGDIRSTRPLLEQLVDEVVQPAIRSNFETQGTRLGGNHWVSLSQYTLEDKAKHGYPSDILVRTGRLKRRATSKAVWTFNGQQGHAFITASSFGEHHKVAVAHHTGTARMPDRPFLAVTPEDVNKMEQIVNEWISDNFNARIGLKAEAQAMGDLV